MSCSNQQQPSGLKRSRRRLMRRRRQEEAKGLLWRLPAVKSKDLGKLGPAIGYGAGCGLGLGFGLFGGVGLGAGIPSPQIGFGIGAGCGIGIGFGYGVGKGIAHDENGRYSNVGKLFRDTQNYSTENQIDDLVDELHENTRKLIKTTAKEIEKWR